MSRRKERGIPADLLDQLLAGTDAATALDQGGLLDSLKKALAERVLSAEMDYHLGHDVAPASHIFGKADVFRGFPLIDKLRRDLKDKNQLLTGRGSPRRRPKMCGQIRRSVDRRF